MKTPDGNLANSLETGTFNVTENLGPRYPNPNLFQ